MGLPKLSLRRATDRRCADPRREVFGLYRMIFCGEQTNEQTVPTRKKPRIALDWTLDLFFSKDLVHFMILRSADESRPGGTA
jgi:hypothetical protein